jgi:ABC-type lipoprotein release transport system permease subunit
MPWYWSLVIGIAGSVIGVPLGFLLLSWLYHWGGN